ncbi:hypothetical protein PCE1_002980 [Barthelona sp. PCE]
MYSPRSEVSPSQKFVDSLTLDLENLDHKLNLLKKQGHELSEDLIEKYMMHGFPEELVSSVDVALNTNANSLTRNLRNMKEKDKVKRNTRSKDSAPINQQYVSLAEYRPLIFHRVRIKQIAQDNGIEMAHSDVLQSLEMENIDDEDDDETDSRLRMKIGETMVTDALKRRPNQVFYRPDDPFFEPNYRYIVGYFLESLKPKRKLLNLPQGTVVKYFMSDTVGELVVSLFWYFHIQIYERGPTGMLRDYADDREEELLAKLLAANMVSHSMFHEYHDALFEFVPYAISFLICQVFFHSFPAQREVFQEAFLRDVYVNTITLLVGLDISIELISAKRDSYFKCSEIQAFLNNSPSLIHSKVITVDAQEKESIAPAAVQKTRFLLESPIAKRNVQRTSQDHTMELLGLSHSPSSRTMRTAKTTATSRSMKSGRPPRRRKKIQKHIQKPLFECSLVAGSTMVDDDFLDPSLLSGTSGALKRKQIEHGRVNMLSPSPLVLGSLRAIHQAERDSRSKMGRHTSMGFNEVRRRLSLSTRRSSVSNTKSVDGSPSDIDDLMDHLQNSKEVSEADDELMKYREAATLEQPKRPLSSLGKTPGNANTSQGFYRDCIYTPNAKTCYVSHRVPQPSTKTGERESPYCQPIGHKAPSIGELRKFRKDSKKLLKESTNIEDETLKEILQSHIYYYRNLADLKEGGTFKQAEFVRRMMSKRIAQLNQKKIAQRNAQKTFTSQQRREKLEKKVTAAIEYEKLKEGKIKELAERKQEFEREKEETQERKQRLASIMLQESNHAELELPTAPQQLDRRTSVIGSLLLQEALGVDVHKKHSSVVSQSHIVSESEDLEFSMPDKSEPLAPFDPNNLLDHLKLTSYAEEHDPDFDCRWATTARSYEREDEEYHRSIELMESEFEEGFF